MDVHVDKLQLRIGATCCRGLLNRWPADRAARPRIGLPYRSAQPDPTLPFHATDVRRRSSLRAEGTFVATIKSPQDPGLRDPLLVSRGNK